MKQINDVVGHVAIGGCGHDFQVARMVGRQSISKSYVSRFPVLGEWHGGAGPVMPVWHDIHRTGGSTLLAAEAPTDRRPGQVLRQGIQPNIDHASIANARALDVAGHVAVREPFGRAARWVFAFDRECGRCEAQDRRSTLELLRIRVQTDLAYQYCQGFGVTPTCPEERCNCYT